MHHRKPTATIAIVVLAVLVTLLGSVVAMQAATDAGSPKPESPATDREPTYADVNKSTLREALQDAVADLKEPQGFAFVLQVQPPTETSSAILTVNTYSTHERRAAAPTPLNASLLYLSWDASAYTYGPDAARGLNDRILADGGVLGFDQLSFSGSNESSVKGLPSVMGNSTANATEVRSVVLVSQATGAVVVVSLPDGRIWGYSEAVADGKVVQAWRQGAYAILPS